MATDSGATSAARTLRELTFSFAWVGLFTFGGGQAAIPLIRREVVQQHSWMSEQEFMDLYALASALPGPIGINMAGYIGYRLAGWTAAAVSAG